MIRIVTGTALMLMLSVGLSYAECPTDMRDVVRDESNGTVIHSTSGACVRTQWMNNYDACGRPPVVHARSTQIAVEDRTVYFGFNQTSLSPEMKERLDTLAANLRSDEQVTGARIVGYADRIGRPGYNEKLSKKRAEVVRRYLVSRGIVNMRVAKTRWLGSSEPQTNCPSDITRPALIDCLQKDRRVEVEIDYAPE